MDGGLIAPVCRIGAIDASSASINSTTFFKDKAKFDCSRCDKCYGTKSGSSDSNNSNKFITVDPSSNLSKVIVNNIKNTDLNDILD